MRVKKMEKRANSRPRYRVAFPFRLVYRVSMRNKAFPTLYVPVCPRWVRETLRLEMKATGETVADIIVRCIKNTIDPVRVSAGKSRAVSKVASQHLATHAELMAYIRGSRPTADDPADVAQDADYTRFLAVEDPGCVPPRRAGIHLAPDED